MGMVGSFTARQVKQYADDSQSFVTDDAARGLFSILRDDVHHAGWGQVVGADAHGWPPIGQCSQTGAYEVIDAVDLACTNRDENNHSDRIRIAYGRTNMAYVQQASSPSLGPCVGSTQIAPPADANHYSMLLISPNDMIFINNNSNPLSQCHFISGQCVEGSVASQGTAIFCEQPGAVYVPNNMGCAYTILGYYHNYSFEPDIGCTKGWKTGWTFAQADVASYYLMPGVGQSRYSLWRRTNTRAFSILDNVSNFHVSYGVDLSVPMDGKLDDCSQCSADDPYPTLLDSAQSWCRDLESLCNLTLSDGTPVTQSTIYNRIVSIHVSFDVFDSDPTLTRSYGATISLKNRLTP